MDQMAYKRFWVDKNGNKHRISKMTNNHLDNTIKFLEKQAEQRAMSLPYPNFNGDMAQYCAENEWEQAIDHPIEFFLYGTVYDYLIQEQNKRKLINEKRN